MKILVCGGAGYIGSNMVALLKETSHEPIVFDNLIKGHRDAIGDTELIIGDIGDYDLMLKTLIDKKIDAVMHFAAFLEVGESVEVPLTYYDNNVSKTQSLLTAMEIAGVDKFIFSSTAAVYGQPEKVPIQENDRKFPINPYGQTKYAVERMCHWQANAGKLKYAALRYFNACGAGLDGKIGEDHKPESHLIPLIMQAALGQRDHFNIYGTDYQTQDGTCIRDYIHVTDLCSAHLLALEKLDTEKELTYNLGNGNGYSVRQVIETVRKVSGVDFKVIEADRRPGDPAVLTADASKAKKELGWECRYGQLETIIETAWKWHKNNPNGYKDC